LREALELARQAQDRTAQLRCLIPLAHACGGADDKDGALAAIAEARTLIGGTTDRIVECELLKTEGLVSYYIGDLAQAAKSAHRALELAKEWGFAYEAAVNAHNLGETYLHLGDYKRAFAMLRYSYDVAKDHGFVKLQFGNMRVLGFIDAIKLHSAEGRVRILEAYEYALEHHYVWDIVQSRYMLAVVDYTQDRVEDGRLGLREVHQLAREYGMRHYEKLAEAALQAADKGEPIQLRV
jgi:tetratricopeptide (TPR) repeat protein